MKFESEMSDLGGDSTIIGLSPASTKRLMDRLREVADLVRGLELDKPGFYLVYKRDGERFAYRIIRAARVGRSPEAEISLDDPWLSHIHFICMQTETGLVVSDPDSSNGTFVNGVRIQKRELVPGDIIRAGDVHFTFLEEPE